MSSDKIIFSLLILTIILFCSCAGNTITVDEYRPIIRTNPSESDKQYNLGIVYSILEREGDAVAAFQNAVALNPDDAEAYFNLGIALNTLGRDSEAAEAYKKAFSLKKIHSKHYKLGWAYFTLGRYEEAVEELKLALLNNDPHPITSYFRMGVAYFELKKYTESIETFNMTLKLNPKVASEIFNVYYFLGMNFQNLGENQTAVDAYNNAIRFRPDFPHSYVNLATLLYALNEKESALEVYRSLKNVNNDLAEQLLEVLEK